jgi:hypothetical protein
MAALSIIPADQRSIYDVIRTLQTLQYQAIVRPNNPPSGVAGFIFDVVGDEEMEITSDITDHFVEDNTAIQDQISLKPEKYTVKGIVAELVATQPLQQAQAPTVNPLPLFAGFLPVFTLASTELQLATAAAATATEKSVADTQSLYGYFNGSIGSQSQTRQSKAFAYFYQLWKGRQLFSVETPWGVMNDMAIESLTPSQGADSKTRTDFSITFKKLRFAQTITVNVGQLAGRAAQQRASTTQQAKATTTTCTEPQKQSFIWQMAH